MNLQYIESHGYRVTSHADGSCTIYVLISTNGDEQGFHVKTLEQARSAMGY